MGLLHVNMGAEAGLLANICKEGYTSTTSTSTPDTAKKITQLGNCDACMCTISNKHAVACKVCV